MAADAERHKQTNYSALSTTYNFVSLVFETFGAFGDESSVFLQDISRRMLLATPELRSAEFLIQNATDTSAVQTHTTRT
jgi:hypothetical protein